MTSVRLRLTGLFGSVALLHLLGCGNTRIDIDRNGTISGLT